MDAEEWFERVLAGERLTTALVVVGGQGSGKSRFGRYFTSLVGHGVHYTNSAGEGFQAFENFADRNLIVFDETADIERIEKFQRMTTATVMRKGQDDKEVLITANILILAQTFKQEPNGRFIVITVDEAERIASNLN